MKRWRPLLGPGLALTALVLAVLAVTLAGIPVRPPRTFLLQLAIGVLPFAFACAWVFQWAGFRALLRRGWHASAVCGGLGLLAVIAYTNLFAWWVFALGALFSGALTRGRVPWGRIGLQVTTLATGYAALWLVQYVAAAQVQGRLLDSWFVAIDLWVYRDWLGIATDYTGIFPLVHGAFAFTVLERAYFLLFGEIFVAALITGAAGTRFADRFSGILFAGYAVALAVFLIVPVVGPCIYRPDSFREVLAATSTAQVMAYMAADFWRSAPDLTGYGYFVALPSMHVAIAVYLHRVFSWHVPHLAGFFFVPNVLLSASTVLLGYHYLLDLPAGIVLGIVMGRVYVSGLVPGGAAAADLPSSSTPSELLDERAAG